MVHENKNTLTDYFYKEVSEAEAARVRNHLSKCEICRAYLVTLQDVEYKLNQVQDERPVTGTFDKIMARIPTERPRVVLRRPTVTPGPIFQIAFSLIFILLFIYFVQSKISLLPAWQSWQEYWVIETFGSFGFVALMFLGIGTFISLSMAPVLYFLSHNKRVLT